MKVHVDVSIGPVSCWARLTSHWSGQPSSAFWAFRDARAMDPQLSPARSTTSWTTAPFYPPPSSDHAPHHRNRCTGTAGRQAAPQPPPRPRPSHVLPVHVSARKPRNGREPPGGACFGAPASHGAFWRGCRACGRAAYLLRAFFLRLMLLFGSPLAQWSYGYFTDSACTKAGKSISMDGKVQEKTGVALGGCIKNKYGTLEWSYSLKSCKVDGNGAPSMQYAGPALRCCCSNAHGLPL